MTEGYWQGYVVNDNPWTNWHKENQVNSSIRLRDNLKTWKSQWRLQYNSGKGNYMEFIVVNWGEKMGKNHDMLLLKLQLLNISSLASLTKPFFFFFNHQRFSFIESVCRYISKLASILCIIFPWVPFWVNFFFFFLPCYPDKGVLHWYMLLYSWW